MLGCQVLGNTFYTCFVILGFFSKVVYSKKDTRQNMHSHSVAVSVRCKVIGAKNRSKIFAYGINYISSEREFIGESESSKILEKYIDFAIL